MKNTFLIVFSCLMINVSCQESIKPEEAKNHIGENVTVCGKVVSANYASSSKGKPTFLNLNKPYPNQVFTIVIWQDVRNQFDNKPEIYYLNKDVCVTGKVSEYKGRPQIILSNKNKIQIK